MTIEEAIYCMKSYLPDTNSYTECKKCKYYKSKMDARGCYLCQSSEAHKMAIRSLEAWQKVKEDIAIKSLGEWYVGRTDGKSEDVILTKDVYDIITKHLKEVEND